MNRIFLMASAAVAALSVPAYAQDVPPQEAGLEESEIIVTATRREQQLSDVPLAVSAVTADTLARSGASDIRQLNQLSPSLLVSSTSSEAAGGGARIRGIGTVGDNPGLESSVATFVDGVYRNRAGVGLTELGAIDRIEVLRGPQGTLFGRNASAGLIHVITASPSSEFGATAEATYGNYDAVRLVGGITGPISDAVSARLDGVYSKRDGFLTDVVSGKGVNNRDRYMLRGQLKFEPTNDLTVRLIADYSDRNEDCCAAPYYPAATVSRDENGNLVRSPSTLAAGLRLLGGIINDTPFDRKVSITPGQSYRGDVRDWGVSGEVNYDLGGAKLTSITAYRNWRWLRGQDADFNNLDILHRQDDGSANQQFKTFTQELRLQGNALDDRLDWLVGGYFAHETLTLNDNLAYGDDYTAYADLLTRAALPSFAGYAATGVGLSTLLSLPAPLSFDGVQIRDRYKQTSRNYAVFTHNSFKLSEMLTLTLGLRYTNEKKTLDARFEDNNAYCRVLSGLSPSSPAYALGRLACVIPSIPNGSYTQDGTVKKEDKLTGTAVLSYKPSDDVLTYASFSRGYKAGGFNLDRNSLYRLGRTDNSNGNRAIDGSVIDTAALEFKPETVDAFEIGFKYDGRGIDINLAAFYQHFQNFQLNTFNGVNFVVENVQGCSALAGGGGSDADAVEGNSACTGKTKSGVTSKGVELEAFLRPMRDISVNLGVTYADTRYADDLIGNKTLTNVTGSLSSAFFQLPGARLSNSAKIVTTGAVSWTPDLGSKGLKGLVYVDGRYTTKLNTGSDLDAEKLQKGYALFNARLGVHGPDNRWGIEAWAQNLFNVNYQQIAFDMPLQGSGATNAVAQGLAASSNQLYGLFLGEPRTYGITVRHNF
ncbi:MAG: TonB-dependent receptor [Chakrabartia sp.]